MIDALPELDGDTLEPSHYAEHDPGLDQLEPDGIVEPWNEQPVAASDWTRMSLDLSAFQTGQRSATSGAPSTELPRRGLEPTLEPSADVAPAASDESLDPMPPVPALSALPPPPPTARMHGEFDAPLAPPVTVGGPSRGPVAPTSARSAPARLPTAVPPPSLPTRTSGLASDRPDPLTEVDDPHDPHDPAPTALQSALATLGADPTGSNGPLPTRSRHDDTMMTSEEPPIATTPSQLDPEALRQRLRAFQTEFSMGGATTDPLDDHDDAGGDRR
jgi:hypothetical protein